MAPQVIHCQQGTDEWKAYRTGIITCSELDSVMAKGRTKDSPSLTRRTYMLKLIGEQFTGEPSEGWEGNKHTDRGHLHEPIARSLYEEKTGNKVDQVGIILNHGIGYSPDGLVGEDGAVEIKSKLPHLLLHYLLSDSMPPEHTKQMQGGLWVAEREWCDLVVFYPGMKPYIKRAYRDEKLIAEIKQAVEAFYSDMDELLQRIVRNW